MRKAGDDPLILDAGDMFFSKTNININNINSFILVTWHGKCLGVMEHFRQRNYHVLISQSRDGDIISNISKKYGYSLFRGSSNRGGKEAMGENV